MVEVDTPHAFARVVSEAFADILQRLQRQSRDTNVN